MPGSGIGRVAGFSTSGPPGSLISMAVMVAGKLVIGRDPHGNFMEPAARRIA
jgi:hypothetical protein